MGNGKQNMFYYRLAQAVSWLVATFIFKRKIIRNEISGKKGPFVVIANHQAALDFVNLIGITKKPMTFVISNSFYNTLPIKGILNKIGVIPKQQFQTTVRDMKKMKSVIDGGGILVIYPAGLMCEDGLSTPIPIATYKFLKWLDTDVYVAKTTGTYFAMPKWANGLRPGKTFLDVYRLFTKEQLAQTSIEDVKEETDKALLFDAYREQEKLLVKYKNNNNIQGLENVLYMCPECKREFSVQLKNTDTLYCTECGFEQYSDEFGFMHCANKTQKEVRHVSHWSKIIYNQLKEKIVCGQEAVLSADTKIHMIDSGKKKYKEVGGGNITLTSKSFCIKGEINGQNVDLEIPICNFASLPFSPGKYLEIQHGEDIYRCLLNDGKLVMKFINMVKIYYQLNTQVYT